jgi:hypothetical protein
MVNLRRIACLCALLLLSAPAQTARFFFAGIGLSSDFRTVAARYPHSDIGDGHITVVRADSQDHVSEISISGSGQNRMVRVGFEFRLDNGRLDYPACADVQRGLVLRYGPPTSSRQFMEEAVRDTEVLWQSDTEELRLRCFQHGRGRALAEAVVISPRAGHK